MFRAETGGGKPVPRECRLPCRQKGKAESNPNLDQQPWGRTAFCRRAVCTLRTRMSSWMEPICPAVRLTLSILASPQASEIVQMLMQRRNRDQPQFPYRLCGGDDAVKSPGFGIPAAREAGGSASAWRRQPQVRGARPRSAVASHWPHLRYSGSPRSGRHCISLAASAPGPWRQPQVRGVNPRSAASTPRRRCRNVRRHFRNSSSPRSGRHCISLAASAPGPWRQPHVGGTGTPSNILGIGTAREAGDIAKHPRIDRQRLNSTNSQDHGSSPAASRPSTIGLVDGPPGAFALGYQHRAGLQSFAWHPRVPGPGRGRFGLAWKSPRLLSYGEVKAQDVKFTQRDRQRPATCPSSKHQGSAPADCSDD